MASKSRRRSILKSRNSIGSGDTEEIIPDVQPCAVTDNTTTLLRNAKRVSFSAKPEIKEIPNLCVRPVRRQDEGIDMEMTFCAGGEDVYPECEISPYDENLPIGTMDMSMSETIHESRKTSISRVCTGGDYVFRKSEFPPLGTFNDNVQNRAMDSGHVDPDQLCANNTTALLRKGKRVSLSSQPEVKEIPNLCARKQEEGIDMEMTFCTGDDVFPDEYEMSAFRTYNENLPIGTMDMSMSKTFHKIESRQTSNSTNNLVLSPDSPAFRIPNPNHNEPSTRSTEDVNENENWLPTIPLWTSKGFTGNSDNGNLTMTFDDSVRRQEEDIDMDMTYGTGNDVFPQCEISAFKTFNENLLNGTMEMSMSKTIHKIESKQTSISANNAVPNPAFKTPNTIIKPHNEPSTRSSEDVTDIENAKLTVPVLTSKGFTGNSDNGNLTMTFDHGVRRQDEETDMDMSYGTGNDVFPQCEISAFKTFNENLLNETMEMSMSKTIHEIESKQTSISTNNVVPSPAFKTPYPIIKPHNELPKCSTENVTEDENALPAPVPISTSKELTGNASEGNLTMTLDHSLRIQDEEIDMEMTFNTDDDVLTDYYISAFKTFNENLPNGATDMSMSKTMHQIEPKITSISTNNAALGPVFGIPNPNPIFEPHNELPTRSTEHVTEDENMLPTVPILTNKGFIDNSKKGNFSMAFDRVVYSGPAHFRKNNADALRKQFPGSYGRFASAATPKRKNTVFKHGTSVEVQTTPSLANECKSASTSAKSASTSTKSASTSTKYASISTKSASTSMACSMLKMNASPLMDGVKSPKVSVTALNDSIQAESIKVAEVVVADKTEEVHAVPKFAPSSEEVAQNDGENLPVVPKSAPGSQEAKQVDGETLPVVPKYTADSEEVKQDDVEIIPSVPKSTSNSEEVKQDDVEIIPPVPKSTSDSEEVKQDDVEIISPVPKSTSNSEEVNKKNRETVVEVNQSNESAGIFEVSRATCISTDSEDDSDEDIPSSNLGTIKIGSYNQNGPFMNLLQLLQNSVGVGRVVLLYKLKIVVCSLPNQQFEDFNEAFGEHNFPEDLLKSCKINRDLKVELLKPLYVGLEQYRNANANI